MKKLVLGILLLSIISLCGFSQEKRVVGISGSIQSGHTGILLPIWVGDKTVIAPVFDFKFIEKIAIDFGIAVVPRFYFNTEKLAPYVGLKFGFMANFPSSENVVDEETQVDIMGGLAFGAEYFIAEKFSVGIEAQANLTKSDNNSLRFGNPDGININTGTMISATLYF